MKLTGAEKAGLGIVATVWTFVLAFWVIVIYVALHFILKAW